MREILQITGCVIAVISAMVVDASAILRFKSSKKDNMAESWLIEGILRGSAVGIVILLVFALLSLLF